MPDPIQCKEDNDITVAVVCDSYAVGVARGDADDEGEGADRFSGVV